MSGKCPQCSSKVLDLVDNASTLSDIDLTHLNKDQELAIRGISRWYRKVVHPAVNAEAIRYSIDVTTEQGQFEIFCLALLLSAGKSRQSTETAFTRLRARGLISFQRITSSNNHQEHIRKIAESLDHLPESQAESFAKRIVISALKISREFDGKLSDLWNVCRQNGDRLISSLAETEARGGSYGLGDKSFWLAREMKLTNLWDVNGEFCCASESSKLKILVERIGFELPIERRPVPRMMRVSKLIWSCFGEDYDIPAVSFVEQVCQEEPDCSNCVISQHCNHGRTALESKS